MTLAGVSFKLILIIVGLIIAIVGIFTNNWKLGVIGNTISIIGVLIS